LDDFLRIRFTNLKFLSFPVAGGPGAWICILRSVGGFENVLITKKIEFTKNWNKPLEKHKSILPKYEKY
jgi:hypothetical protein